MVKRGEKGDASVLKPSIMFCVPLILDRIYKVDNRMDNDGHIIKQMFSGGDGPDP